MTEEITVLDGMFFEGKEEISVLRTLILRNSLLMETRGLRLSGGSAYAIVKREFGFRGNKVRVLDQLSQHMRERGILKDEVQA